jgi:hypothetical protein
MDHSCLAEIRPIWSPCIEANIDIETISPMNQRNKFTLSEMSERFIEKKQALKTCQKDFKIISCTYIHLLQLRVTKLGEFSSIRRLFALGTFFTITEVAQIFVQLFSTE